MSGLNKKQRLFCQHYVKTGDAKASYVAAGYTAKGAVASAAITRLLKSVKINEYVAELNSEVQIYDNHNRPAAEVQQERKAIADAAEIQETLTKIMRGEIKEERPIRTIDGYTMAETIPCNTDRIAAAKQLSKMQGLDAPELKVTTTYSATLSGADADVLRQRLEQLRAKAGMP